MNKPSLSSTVRAASDPSDKQPVTKRKPLSTPDSENALQILIVDDNVTVAKALGMLVKKAGWEPLVFNSAAAALSHVEKNATPPAAAVVDIHMPDLNGLVLSQKLRDTFGLTPPIIVLSGDTSTETIRSLAHVGATYFFSKPVNGKHLIEKIRTLMEENTINPNDPNE